VNKREPDCNESVIGCGTVEWNVLSGEVENNREMQKLGRSGRRPINE
jgi:hypothetical protein